MKTFEVGEQLIWTRVNDETGKQLNDLITVMSVRSYPDSAYYVLRVEATGEPAAAWHDELARFREI